MAMKHSCFASRLFAFKALFLFNSMTELEREMAKMHFAQAGGKCNATGHIWLPDCTACDRWTLPQSGKVLVLR